MVSAAYAELIRTFLDGKLGAEEFRRRYLESFKADPKSYPPDVFAVLDRLFADADAFCADPALRDEGDLDEAGLRAAADRTLRDLERR